MLTLVEKEIRQRKYMCFVRNIHTIYQLRCMLFVFCNFSVAIYL